MLNFVKYKLKIVCLFFSAKIDKIFDMRTENMKFYVEILKRKVSFGALWTIVKNRVIGCKISLKRGRGHNTG